MHFERLTIEAGDATFALDLHPRMTVIAGVGPLEREGLMSELIGALSSGRSGVHLEMASDAGARYAVRRPAAGRHEVVDLDHDRDVTAMFTDADGRVNVLERAGLDVRSAKRAMRLTEHDLTTRSEYEDRVLTLAHIDQNRLWDLAKKVKQREADVTAVATSVGAPDDAAVFAEIERRHATFEAAQERHESARRVSLLVGANAAVLAMLVGIMISPLLSIPLVLVAIGMTAYSAWFWFQADEARRREEQALQSAGAHSYLTFQINRVNNLIADDQRRKEMMKAAEYHRSALAEWHLIVGDIPVDWALEHRGEIRQAAARLRDTLGVKTQLGQAVPVGDAAGGDLAHALLQRLDEAQHLGAGGESFPMFLDDPFRTLDGEDKAELLELLVRASQQQQLIFLTEDEDVASWARLEAMTGHISLIEPGGKRNGDRKSAVA